MLLIDETTVGEVRVRTLACDECRPGEACDTKFLCFQARNEQLWAVLVMLHGDDDAAVLAVESVAEELSDLAGRVERYLALVGLTWPVLVNNGQACLDQVLVCNALPDWMHRLDIDLLWDTRRCVFGHDLIRVPRALKAAHRYYTPDVPALEPWQR